MRRSWLLWLLTIGFGWVVLTHAHELAHLGATIVAGRWQWLIPTWAAFRISLMVMAATVDDAPARFEDLGDARFANRFSSGDPMSSGTSFITLAAWQNRYGWDWLRAIEAGEGAIYAKTGADGFYVAALPGVGLGVALKCDDGLGAAAELMLASVLLHLLGHDDHDPAARRRMRSAERRWLERLGRPAVFGRRS